MTDIINMIRDSNPKRTHNNLHRRIIKVFEEIGEVSEAYLNVSSETNDKGKTWDDVREELVDAMIVVVDCLLTPMPDQENFTPEQIETVVVSEVRRKLDKWNTKRSSNKVNTDAE